MLQASNETRVKEFVEYSIKQGWPINQVMAHMKVICKELANPKAPRAHQALAINVLIVRRWINCVQKQEWFNAPYFKSIKWVDFSQGAMSLGKSALNIKVGPKAIKIGASS